MKIPEGYNHVELEQDEALTGLTNGMIDGSVIQAIHIAIHGEHAPCFLAFIVESGLEPIPGTANIVGDEEHVVGFVHASFHFMDADQIMEWCAEHELLMTVSAEKVEGGGDGS